MPVIQVPEYSDTIPVGKVIRTDPPVGDMVFAAGTTITEYVSLGPEPTDVAVPNIKNYHVTAALTRITDAPLIAGVVTYVVDRAHPYRVIAQNPPAGTELPVGSPVDYTVTAPFPVGRSGGLMCAT
jgi:beta-lactam-binding protein with PASTA domain